MNTIMNYSKATDPQPPAPERDIDEHVSDLMTWGSTTMGLGCNDIYKDDLTLELSEEMTTEQLQHAFNLALDHKSQELIKYIRTLLVDQAKKMVEYEDSKAA